MRFLAGLLGALFSAPLLVAAAPAPMKVVGYFAEWSIYDRKFHIADIPAARLTHINYAFVKIDDKGEIALLDSYAAIDKAYPGDKWDPGTLRGNFNQLLELKKKHPHLKTLVSVGGWNHSGKFSDVALTDESRSKFARSCVAFLVKYGFDGVDLDWEYPCGGGLESNKVRKEDGANYTLLLQAIRKELDARGKLDKRAYLLTIAASGSPKIAAALEMKKLADTLDWINVMTYDFHGGWSDKTNFNAPLNSIATDTDKAFNVTAAVKLYRTGGVPAEKIVVGMPFYGRGWKGVKNENDGLNQPHKEIPRGTWESGVFDYKDLAANYVPKMKRHWHKEAQVPWLYDDKSGVMISYDDPESLRCKAQFIRQEKLGGAMIWELSADDKASSLLKALTDK